MRSKTRDRWRIARLGAGEVRRPQPENPDKPIRKEIEVHDHYGPEAKIRMPAASCAASHAPRTARHGSNTRALVAVKERGTSLSPEGGTGGRWLGSWDILVGP